jgi:XTP/dITP diphosphohydrolase
LTEEGECRGEVLTEPRGSGGFGYDPALYLPQLGKGMAELGVEEKARISHRGEAFRRMRPHLEAYRLGRWP